MYGIDPNFRVHLGFEDHVLFRPSVALHIVRDDVAVGKVINGAVGGNCCEVQVYLRMTSDFLQRHSLPPVTTANFPLSSQSAVMEVVSHDVTDRIDRDSIVDVAFVVPLAEAESGLYNLSWSYNSFLIRYSLHQGNVHQYRSEYYFVSRPVEPLSIRLFHSLNYLAGLLKRALYHQGEAEISCRSFRLFFSCEAFSYLSYKLRGVAAVLSAPRKQSFVVYYDSLSMEARCSHVTKTLLRIVSKEGLCRLRLILGSIIGLGLTKRKPTKSNPLIYCSVGSFITSVDVMEEFPMELINNMNRKYHSDCIEFLYTEENRLLTCSVWYSKIIVNSSEEVRARFPMADVHNSVIAGAYVSANFHYNNILMTVHGIVGNVATCRYLPEDGDSNNSEDYLYMDLPVDQVHELVSMFGR
jgi:hypothetical protein